MTIWICTAGQKHKSSNAGQQQKLLHQHTTPGDQHSQTLHRTVDTDNSSKTVENPATMTKEEEVSQRNRSSINGHGMAASKLKTPTDMLHHAHVRVLTQ